MALMITVGSSDLRRKPLAPASAALIGSPSASKVVRMTISGGFFCCLMRLVASMPFIFFMRTSMRMTSGFSMRAA